MKNLLFRKDIQGLRGLAIFFVLIFHFYPKMIPNGFLGVDLFFVISGYLITLIFFQKKKKSFLVFFFNRLIRIFPSILAVIIFTAILAFFFFLPIDLSNFWYSSISSLFFFPNLYFLFNGGYFGGINELKPLLHLWSLGVEIQFYFFFPMFLFLVSKFFKRNFLFFILFVFAISFLLNFFLISNNYDSLAFFMLPARIWEFCLGSIVFFIPDLRTKNKINYIIYALSIIAIFFLIILDIKISNFFKQVLLIFLTSLIIYLGKNIKNDNYFLGNNFFQFLGKISYSLYLVHWPILVFFKYYLIDQPTDIQLIFLLIATLFFSYFFWFFIENYFRYKIHPLRMIKYIIGSIFFIIFLFSVNFFNNSFPERINDRAIKISNSINSNYHCNITNYTFLHKVRACKLFFNNAKPQPNIILLGNSHAQMYGYAFEKILKTNKLNGLIIPVNACLPTIDINISIACIFKAKNNLNEVLKYKNIQHVIIGLNWEHAFLVDDKGKELNNTNNILLTNSVFKLIQILENQNMKTVLIGPISEPNYQFSSVASREAYFNKSTKSKNFRETKQEFENKFANVFDFFSDKKYTGLFKPHVVQCKNDQCVFSIENNSLFSDNSHLSTFGSLLMKNSLLEQLQNR